MTSKHYKYSDVVKYVHNVDPTQNLSMKVRIIDPKRDRFPGKNFFSVLCEESLDFLPPETAILDPMWAPYFALMGYDIRLFEKRFERFSIPALKNLYLLNTALLLSPVAWQNKVMTWPRRKLRLKDRFRNRNVFIRSVLSVLKRAVPHVDFFILNVKNVPFTPVWDDTLGRSVPNGIDLSMDPFWANLIQSENRLAGTEANGDSESYLEGYSPCPGKEDVYERQEIDLYDIVKEIAISSLDPNGPSPLEGFKSLLTPAAHKARTENDLKIHKARIEKAVTTIRKHQEKKSE